MIVIQSYLRDETYSEEDQALFALIANRVSNALQGLQRLGGTVKVESAPGEGLRYHLRFPESLRTG